MNVLSLFDGISCGRIALDRAGLSVDNYFASEIDKHAIRVSQSNWPSIIQLGDVVNLDTSKLPKIDLLIGGSPCQGFSFAGKQLNFNDPRSKLFWEYVRVLKNLNPKHFFLENVVMKKEYRDVITNALGVEPILIDSELISASFRKRYYWTNITMPKAIERKDVKISDILECPLPCSDGSLLNLIPCTIGSSRDRRFRKTGKFGCLTATMFKGVRAAGRPIVGVPGIIGKHIDQVVKSEYRMITPIESERCLTIPDNYTSSVSKTQRYKSLGNGWTVDVVAHIFRGINE